MAHLYNGKTKEEKYEKIHGILCVVLSAIGFGIMPILAKLAYSGGANVQTTLFLRFHFTTIMLFLLHQKQKYSLKLDKKTIYTFNFLGVAGYSFNINYVIFVL